MGKASTGEPRLQQVDSDTYGRDYYLHSYDEDPAKFLDRIRRAMSVVPEKQVQLGRIKPGSKVLEIGCGTGSLFTRLAYWGCEVVAVDYSRDAIRLAEQARSVLPSQASQRIRLLCQDAKSIPFENEFDVAFMMDFVEHVHDWELGIIFQKVYRALKPGGRLVIFTKPNLSWIRWGFPIKQTLGIPRTLFRKWFRKRTFETDYDRREFERKTWHVIRTLPELFALKIARYLELFYQRDRYNYSPDMHVNEMTPWHLRRLLKDFRTKVWCEEPSRNVFAKLTQKWWGPHLWAVAEKVRSAETS